MESLIFVAGLLRYAAPVAFAAIGEAVGQRSGVINIGIDARLPLEGPSSKLPGSTSLTSRPSSRRYPISAATRVGPPVTRFAAPRIPTVIGCMRSLPSHFIVSFPC